MKRFSLPSLLGLALMLACSACDQMHSPFGSGSAKRQTPEQNGSSHGSYAADGSGCNGQAQSRMAMYDRPSTYPISDSERHDAYQALYSECMREHDWQVAGPGHSNPTWAANTGSAAQFANLSPAAGGAAGSATTVNAGNTIVSSSSVPGATVVVIGGSKDANLAQLSSLSPSAGGNNPQNATVVLVQSPTASAVPVQGYYAARMPAAALPVAVPIAPQPAQYQPRPGAAPQQIMGQTMGQTMGYQRSPSMLQPSLAGAAAAAAGSAAPAVQAAARQANANRQLENVLEQ